jgi:N6-L-threonylcarbamoyladenine synthase
MLGGFFFCAMSCVCRLAVSALSFATMTLILGLETSCDETAAAVVRDGHRVLSNVVATQHELHEEYRGVVPEIASRAHIERLMPVVEAAMKEAGVTFAQLDAIAVGNRPGLIGSLLVGVSAAKALAWALDKPLLGIDHVRAHLHAAMLTDALADNATLDAARVLYPALGLVVSGGHTSLYHLRSTTDMPVIGRTIDDAIGEAYDKAAVILDLPYPGGPNLDKLAQIGNATQAIGGPLPVSLLDKDSLDFSFSGLKTALLYRVRGQPTGRGKDATFERSANDLTSDQRADLAAAFQLAAVKAVTAKLNRAMSQLTERGEQIHSLVIGGGVSANSALRVAVRDFADAHKLRLCLPAMAYCVDNAAMIAGLACEDFTAGRRDDLHLPTIATTSM